MVTEMSDNNSADSSVTLLTKQSEDQNSDTWLRLHVKELFRCEREKKWEARTILKFILSHEA